MAHMRLSVEVYNRKRDLSIGVNLDKVKVWVTGVYQRNCKLMNMHLYDL